MFTNRLSGIKVSENKTGRKFYRILRISDARTTETLKMDDFLQKLKKMVRIVLYGPAISQSDCRKVGQYQLPYNNMLLFTNCEVYRGNIRTAVWMYGPNEVRSVRKTKVRIYFRTVNKSFIV